jgi:argininosuccinate synthase
MDIDALIKKVMDTPTEPVTKVAVAYSGGLDSSLAIELLRRKYRAQEIVPITIDVGQGAEELAVGEMKARKLGIKPIVVDAKAEFATEWLPKAIRANSDYNGYPVSTSMTRQLVGRLVALEARKRGCDAVLEGSTGRGNDQYRLHNVFKMFAPELKILVPVREFDLTRSQEEELCKAWDVPVVEKIRGGDDKTMWCRSIASGAIGLNMALPEDIWQWLTWPTEAPDAAERVTMEFAQGVPVKLNGAAMDLDELIIALNVIAGRNGVGYIDMFEDGIMDLKSREVYEAPAAHVILKLHRDLEAQCLTKEQLRFKQLVDQRWAYMVYHGEWYHPLKENLDAFVADSQKFVSGAFEVDLYKGNIVIVSRDSQLSLFNPEIRDINRSGFDQRWCTNAANVRGLPYEILARRNELAARTAAKKPAKKGKK